ncbi:MAG: insulinase family protein [Bacteroidetes bacterium]|nr:insulinase family protein [Bacteroidota bacterium]
MKYTAIVLFLVSSLLSSAQDFSKLDSKMPVNKDVTIGKLDNGLTYYIQHNKKPENKVELRLVVNAGSILETDKQRGLAHFMEHMNFNGTKNFQHNELVDYLQSIGVKFGQHLNAYTSFDETVYILPIPSDDSEKVEKGFDILEDWAFNNLLTPEEVDKERGVVLEELRLGLGADKRMMDNYLPLLMYNSHYADRLPIGLKSVLENFDHSELKDFYTQWYRPNLMSVIVVGDIDVAEMEQKIKDHFGSYVNPKNYKMRQEYFVPDHDETFVAVEHDKEASFTQVQLIYKDKGNPKKGNTIGDYRKGLIKALFNNMINARLSEIANNPNPPYNYGYSYHGSGYSRNKQSYQSFAMTDTKNQVRAFETLVIENERVLRFGFLESEFERAKMKLKSMINQQYKDRDKTESGRIVWEYVSHFLEGESIPGISWEYEAYNALADGITVDEVNALIKQFIHDDNRVVIFTSPESEDNTYASKEEILDILKDVKALKLEPYSEGITAKSLMTNSPKMGSIKSTEKLEAMDMTKLVLSNGITVYYKKTDFKDNQIMMKAYSPGGSSLITSHDQYNSVKLAMSGITQGGLNGFSKNDMAKVMAGKRASVTPFVGSNYEGFNGRTVNSDVEEMFQLIYLNFTALNKDEEAYKAYVDKQVAFYGNLLNTPQYWYMNEKIKVLSKNNPRYTNTFPTADEYATQDFDKAYSLFTQRFANAGDFTFIFVGSIDEAQLEQMCTKYLAGLPSTGETEKFVKHDYEKLDGKQELNFYRGADPKSSVEISYRTDAPYDAKQAYYLKCAGEILTIKLVENLREGESGVYGVGASGYASKYPNGTYLFRISFPCGPENVDKLKKAALEELDKLLANGPDQKELDKIKEAQKLELKENMKKNRYWINQIHNLIYYNQPLTDMLNTGDAIEAVTAEDIKTAANKYIGENVVISVLYPEKK